jgi:phytoene desaturase
VSEKQKVAVIGSGIGGLASAIRFAAKGFQVEVFEQAAQAGGKINELRMEGFRFDTGPSLFTFPDLTTELFLLCGENPEEHFRYHPVETSCKYFWEDGTVVNAWQKPEAFAAEIEQVTGLNRRKITAYLQESEALYDLAGESFLFYSLHKASNFLRLQFLKTIIHSLKLDPFRTMHKRNRKWLSHPKVVQLFDRYATYNGSSPYKTPATLRMIAHLEHNMGTFFPEKGMYSIVESLTALALRQGITFHFNAPVQKVNTRDGKVTGIRVNDQDFSFDIVVSDVDVVNFYRRLLPQIPIPPKQLTLERSSSAVIFYWGVNHTFPDLKLHNILFSEDYPGEFNHLFNTKTISPDPTVYLFISSKMVKGDAPGGSENWYVMINAPENTGQNWDQMLKETRRNILEKIKRTLNIDLESYIVAEAMADPRSIEKETASFRGSLYGLSSNNMLSAFNRHPNFRNKIKNLYFAGGSVHPGGGIPLSLASAKIIDKEIPNLKENL